ncbi:MAG: hypothetical protein LBV23_05870 [Deltaproteobacteria bacterium]|nr:hypothetical protein [Deltaproteobacteria bacterium]
MDDHSVRNFNFKGPKLRSSRRGARPLVFVIMLIMAALAFWFVYKSGQTALKRASPLKSSLNISFKSSLVAFSVLATVEATIRDEEYSLN